MELFAGYEYYRQNKLAEPLFPLDIIMMDKLSPESNIKDEILQECNKNECSKEFLKYNIIEGDIRDVV